jgi:hypothetical protein
MKQVQIRFIDKDIDRDIIRQEEKEDIKQEYVFEVYYKVDYSSRPVRRGSKVAFAGDYLSKVGNNVYIAFVFLMTIDYKSKWFNVY